MRTLALAALLAITALPLVQEEMQAQTASAPSTQTSSTSQQTPVHHTSTTAARAKAAAVAKSKAAAADESPVLPPGIPPAPGKLETAFSLRYIDTKIGDGAMVQPGDFITVQYTGWLASDGTKFDSSADHPGQPFTFTQGMHRVIQGWDQGFGGMKVGGKRRLFIPYQLAYGDNGHPPAIPSKSDLIFDIELVYSGATPPPAPETPPPGSPQ